MTEVWRCTTRKKKEGGTAGEVCKVKPGAIFFHRCGGNPWAEQNLRKPTWLTKFTLLSQPCCCFLSPLSKAAAVGTWVNEWRGRTQVTSKLLFQVNSSHFPPEMFRCQRKAVSGPQSEFNRCCWTWKRIRIPLITVSAPPFQASKHQREYLTNRVGKHWGHVHLLQQTKSANEHFLREWNSLKVAQHSSEYLADQLTAYMSVSVTCVCLRPCTCMWSMFNICSHHITETLIGVLR